jgi:HEAT repeat protein
LTDFLGRFLEDSDPQIRACAALAMGESRQADALDALRDHFPREFDSDTRHTILLGAATSRLPQAIEWLVELVGSENIEDAIGAIEALALYRHDEAIAGRVRKAVEANDHPKVRGALKKSFG